MFPFPSAYVYHVCVCMYMYFCICVRVCLCIYNQSSVSQAQIFLLTTRLRPNCPLKLNTCKTKPIIFLNLPSLLFLTLRSEGHLPCQSPRIGSQESFKNPSLQTNVLIPIFSFSLITLIIPSNSPYPLLYLTLAIKFHVGYS